MPRIARVVVPGIPHHVTQRGNRRLQTFFTDEDYAAYRDLIATGCRQARVQVLAWSIMPNHAHLVLVPPGEDGLRQALGEAHRTYAGMINQRHGWRGHLWQARFNSCPMDETHLIAAVRYVELNPVRARLATVPEAWPWSSARAHISRQPDGVTAPLPPPLDAIPSWPAFLAEGLPDEVAMRLRDHQQSGRPLGSDGFVADVEALTKRKLAPALSAAPRKPLPFKANSGSGTKSN
jgi:putative transposase